MHTLAVNQWPLPGDAGFPLNAMYLKPTDRNEEGESSCFTRSASRLSNISEQLVRTG